MTLTSEPTQAVSVHLEANGLCERCSPRGQILLVPSTLTFTPQNWNVTQSVAVFAVSSFAVTHYKYSTELASLSGVHVHTQPTSCLRFDSIPR